MTGPTLPTTVRRAHQPLRNAWAAHVGPRAPGGVVLAVSGGPDSRAMLEMCAHLPDDDRAPLIVAAVDHKSHPASTQAAHDVARRAQALGFAAAVLHADEDGRGLGEAAWRAARYRLLTAHARAHGAATVVVAHHRDDVAEGFLLDLLGWGGGPGGAAMAAVRPLGPGVALCRPFLSLPRATLRAALEAQGVTDVFVDPADEAGDNRRAQARRLLQHWAAETGAALSDRCADRAFLRRDDEDALRAWAASAVARTVHTGEVVLRMAPDVPAAARVALWRRALQAEMAARPSTDPRRGAPTLAACAAAAAAGESGKVFQFSGLDAFLQAPHTVSMRVRVPVPPPDAGG